MLVPMRNLLDRAMIEGYDAVAPSVISECTARVCIEAAEELHAPLILDVGYVFHPDLVFLGHMLEGIAVRSSVPTIVNLDHGATYERVMWALRARLTSVMIDRNVVPFEVNVRDVAGIIKVAYAVQVNVEAELGRVGDGYPYRREACLYASPIQATGFVEQTSVDCLATSIGAAHGICAEKPWLDFRRARKTRQTVGIPLILHGSSRSGDVNLQKTIQCGISKINIGIDSFMTAIKAGGQAGELHMVYHRTQQGFKDIAKHYMHISHRGGKVQKGDNLPPFIERGIPILSRRQKDTLQQLERIGDFISTRTLCETCSLSEKTTLSELVVIGTVLQEQETDVLIRK